MKPLVDGIKTENADGAERLGISQVCVQKRQLESPMMNGIMRFGSISQGKI